jgi:hypothetical protein
VGTQIPARFELAVRTHNILQQPPKVRSAVFTATTFYTHHVNTTPCFVRTRTGAITYKRVGKLFLELTDNYDKLPRCVPLLDSVRTRESSSDATTDQTWSSYPGPWSPFALSVMKLLSYLFITVFSCIIHNCVVIIRTALLLAGSVTMLSVTARVCNRYIARHTCVSSHDCNPCRDPGRGIYFTPQDPVLYFPHWSRGQPRRSCLVDHAVCWIESSHGTIPTCVGDDERHERNAQVTPVEGPEPPLVPPVLPPSCSGSDEGAPAIAMVGLISYGKWAVDLLQRGWVACCSLRGCSMMCSLTFSKPGSWFMGLSTIIWYNLFVLAVLPSWWIGLATMLMYIVVGLIALAFELMFAFCASVPFALFVACILPCLRAVALAWGGALSGLLATRLPPP